ncbi:glycosyltransferase family 2 protein [Thiorhodococcus minor]|uniref:Glycosyltransferase family 2 protein n=1 Tax=Thiorhodococcus minor TaxID=57489 RepID=A0A6M0K3D2_9GAMM|nr:glycosyltransferase family 2 protein [Thiorhodococcus minor]NEV62825.1 glycosyltransferase family 2 protein [Thiorhodococcus minor]
MHKTTILPVVAIMPARNEAVTIGAVVAAVRAEWRFDVLVVDDCSTDGTGDIARAEGATVIRLPLRLGAWGAIQTGLRYAVAQGYQTAVTLDADGQHDSSYIAALLAPLEAGDADAVIGAHPARASRARQLAWEYFRLLTGLKLEDITSGFRAYNRRAMELLASREATLLDYQDVGVLLILHRHRLRTREVSVPMRPRSLGASRIFDSWWTVGKYMAQTSILCIARIGHGRRSSARNQDRFDE